MKPRILCALLLSATPLPLLAVPDATGAVTTAPDLSADAVMTARLNYNLGFEQFEKTQAEEKQAAMLKGAKAKAALQKVMEGYAAARVRFETTVVADPSAKEAWNLIGYTSRRLGEPERALEAYEKALALNPVYPEAIEYRAEAYLALNRLEDAKTAYLALFATSPAHAKVLLAAMQTWVTERRRKPEGVAKPDVEAFAGWVEERAGVAQQTAAWRDPGAALRDWR